MKQMQLIAIKERIRTIGLLLDISESIDHAIISGKSRYITLTRKKVFFSTKYQLCNCFLGNDTLYDFNGELSVPLPNKKFIKALDAYILMVSARRVARYTRIK